MKTDRTGWDDILEPGEEILWQGRPSAKFHIKTAHIVPLLFGLFFSGFALFWMVMAANAGGYFWMFGLLHFSVGIGIGIGPILQSNLRRRNTWYTLTRGRAFIATDLPFVGRHLSSYPIDTNTVVKYDQSNPASIFFAHEFRQGKNRSRRVDIGFEAIENASQAIALIRDIQKAEKP